MYFHDKDVTYAFLSEMVWGILLQCLNITHYRVREQPDGKLMQVKCPFPLFPATGHN